MKTEPIQIPIEMLDAVTADAKKSDRTIVRYEENEACANEVLQLFNRQNLKRDNGVDSRTREERKRKDY